MKAKLADMAVAAVAAATLASCGGDDEVIDFPAWISRGIGTAIDSSGNLLVAGEFTSYDVSSEGIHDPNHKFTKVGIARILPNGTPDAAFGSKGRGSIAISAGSSIPIAIAQAMTLASDGGMIVAGRTQTASGKYDIFVAKTLPSGQLDTAFGTNGVTTFDVGGNDDAVVSVATLPSGAIVVGGWTRADAASDRDFLLARFTSSGQLDTSFGGGSGRVVTNLGADDFIGRIAVRTDGKIVAVGRKSSGNTVTGSSDVAVARYLSDGTPDSSFGTSGTVTQDFGGYDYGLSLESLSDGSLLVSGGSITSNATQQKALVAKFQSNGALDTSFGPGGSFTRQVDSSSDTFGSTILALSDGKFLLGGMYRAGDGNYSVYLVRHAADGQQDTTFGTSGRWSATTLSAQSRSEGAVSLALQPDGKIIVTTANVDNENSLFQGFGLARLSADGILDPSFGQAGLLSFSYTE